LVEEGGFLAVACIANSASGRAGILADWAMIASFVVVVWSQVSRELVRLSVGAWINPGGVVQNCGKSGNCDLFRGYSQLGDKVDSPWGRHK